MRKFFLMIWGISTMALLWLLGSILLSGSTPSRRGSAGTLAEIWAGLTVVYIWARFDSNRKAKREQENDRRLMRAAVKDSMPE